MCVIGLQMVIMKTIQTLPMMVEFKPRVQMKKTECRVVVRGTSALAMPELLTMTAGTPDFYIQPRWG